MASRHLRKRPRHCGSVPPSPSPSIAVGQPMRIAASPWDVTDGWTPFAALSTTAILVEGEEDVRYEVTNSKLGFTVSEGETWTVSGTSRAAVLDLLVGEDRVFGLSLW